MIHHIRRLIFAALFAVTTVNGAELGVLAPVIVDKAPLAKAAPEGGAKAPVVQRVTSGALFDALQKEAASGFTSRMLALDEHAMRIAGQGKTTWLYLSPEDGGFARKGFWLQEGDTTRWVAEHFVDLVVDADSVADGEFEEIFAHELGHVFLRRLLPRLPAGQSRTPHHSFSITDQQTAFDEGWATHFQAAARRFTANARLTAQDQGVEYKAYTPFWMHNSDRNARVDGVRQNWFAHKQVTMPGAGASHERLNLSVFFDRTRLKSAAQMLASEGMLATFFFRHLVPGDADSLNKRYEAIFHALHAMNGGLVADSKPLPALAHALLKTSPAEGARLIKVLVETSYGALSSPTLAAASEAVARAGRFGDAEGFVPALGQARKSMAIEVAAVQGEPARLAAHCGPDLWLLAPGSQLSVNLNTAEVEHLMLLPGVRRTTAGRALASRDRDGDFKSVADFASRTGMKRESLEAMAARARDAGTHGRR